MYLRSGVRGWTGFTESFDSLGQVYFDTDLLNDIEFGFNTISMTQINLAG
mgnify:CR=1 FL=1